MSEYEYCVDLPTYLGILEFQPNASEQLRLDDVIEIC